MKARKLTAMASKKDGKGTKGAKSAKRARNGDADSGGSKGGKSGASTKNMLASGLEKLPKKAYEKELERLQAELVEMQAWLKATGKIH